MTTTGRLHVKPTWVTGRSVVPPGVAVGRTVTVALGVAEREVVGVDAWPVELLHPAVTTSRAAARSRPVTTRNPGWGAATAPPLQPSCLCGGRGRAARRAPPSRPRHNPTAGARGRERAPPRAA